MPADHKQIATLHAKGFARGWSTGEIAALDSEASVTTFVVRCEGEGDAEACGFVMLRQAADEAEILSIAVDPDTRGGGFGHALMGAAIRHCQSERFARLILEVDAGNVPAVALYQRLGFRETGRRVGYYANDAEPAAARHDALVMELSLL
ncbi:MAG: GNAT family N-acetyltransferase [Pseudomonadota bacterium]